MENKEQKLKDMEQFFKYDLNVKNILFASAPLEKFGYNKDSIIEYSDLLFKSINDIEYYIDSILNSFPLNFLANDKLYFKNYIKVIKKELIDCGYNFDKLKHFYEICFSNMSEELKNKVGLNCHGAGGTGVSLSEAKSINEILHVVHQNIINNENNYRALPILDQKKNVEGGNITLYGEENGLARKLYNLFPIDLPSNYAEIMSLSNDKIIIMVRDMGHALSIEIDKENDKYYIKYFIPKICNTIMVNSLKGVNKVDKNSKYTVGLIQTDDVDLLIQVINLIKNVPTDTDMFKEGGACYKGDPIVK